MDSYHNFIDWLKRFECGRQLQSLLEATVPEGEETVFLKTDRDNNMPIVFLAHNQSFIVNGTINFFNENPDVQFTVRKISDITQKNIQMMTISHGEITAFSRFKDVQLELTFQDGSQLLLNKVDFGIHNNSFITTVQSLLKC
ncbi:MULTISPECIES: hypothetical protein [unclassified Paenibacillus]|uniref:hypothetical protein n=1 Tax=unclassified Paenibacillus TaxID=185978 RepID=UPI001AE6217D|nr:MULTISPECIES: hypothetical protein [unclassified Paenibacillus]MBP1154637.1 sulfur transfer protein SufE [Paenibacillus sp. PvP091]MBP1169979.1 sulfur transfer protein SufE [Paenibacillus sp. PvR098]MBP2441007.1 sulfur transfer protein SufE [Paenibacillus sp. PvP052]